MESLAGDTMNKLEERIVGSTMNKNVAQQLGYTKLVFSAYEKPDKVKHTHTYRDFLRDHVDFVIVEKSDKINLMRKKGDYHRRQGRLI